MSDRHPLLTALLGGSLLLLGSLLSYAGWGNRTAHFCADDPHLCTGVPTDALILMGIGLTALVGGCGLLAAALRRNQHAG